MGLVHLYRHHFFMPAIVGLFLLLSSMLVEAAPIMPNVMGLTLEEARQALNARGLNIDSIREQRTNRPTGSVIVQSPRAGLEVISGTPVRLIVAIPLQKPKQTKVPDLKNLSLSEAKAALANAQLRLGKVKQRKMAVEEEYVLYQSPHAGKNLVLNSAVNITLSDPLPITGPRVKLRLDKTQYAVGESIILYADILNPLPNQTPRYSFTINGRAIPSNGSTMVYQAKKAGKYVISASARYGRNPWIASLSRTVYVKAASNTKTQDESSEKEKPSSTASVDEKSAVKWEKPKAVIYPESLTIERGKPARFYSRSTAMKQSGLDYRWNTPDEVIKGVRQISIGTAGLKKNQYKIKLRVKDDRGLVDTVTATLILKGDVVKTEDKPDVSEKAEAQKTEQNVEDNKVEEEKTNKPEVVTETEANVAAVSEQHKNPQEMEEPETSDSEATAQTEQQSASENKALLDAPDKNDMKSPLESGELEQQAASVNRDETQTSIVPNSVEKEDKSVSDINAVEPVVPQVQSLDENALDAVKKNVAPKEPVKDKSVADVTVDDPVEVVNNEVAKIAKTEETNDVIKDIRLKASSVQVLVGNEVKFNIEPVSAVGKDDFELIIEEQNSMVYLPVINAKYAFKKDGTYTLYAKVVDADNNVVETNRITLRVWPVWLPILIALVGGILTILHFRIKKKQKAR
jgi:hypothetical protein